MNLIYIGSLYPQGMPEDLLKLGSVVDFAGHTFQSALLNGLDKHCTHLTVISSALTSSYPNIKRLNFKQEMFSHNMSENKRDVYVGALNLPVIKLYSKYIRVKQQLKQVLKEGEENVVIVYSIHSPFLLAAYMLRKYISKICVIVPDLPEYMGDEGKRFKSLLKKIDNRLIQLCLSRVDGFALLSPHMQDKLPIGNKPWLQFEGIYQVTNINAENIPKEKYKTLMYTGNIYKKRGVDILLQAFSMIKDPDYRLWIRGNGDMKKDIIEISKHDSRVQYFEPMSREELLRMEKRATLMINPTPASWEFTRYFFPSKNMEFMASGTPTLMFRLDCIPEEYYPYLYFCDESAQALRDKILEICDKPQQELDAFGEKASRFIVERKNADVQAGRLLEFINVRC